MNTRAPLPARKPIAWKGVSPLLPPAEPGTLRHFFETVYLPQRLIGRSPRMKKEYRRVIALLGDCVGHEPLFDDLSDKVAADFFAELGTRGYAAGGVNSQRCRLFALWRLAHDQGLVTKPPKVRKLPVEKEAPDAWTLSEMSALLQAADECYFTPIAGIPARRFWRAMLLVGWYTALRKRSLGSLRRDDVDFQRRTIYSAGSGMKTRKGKYFKLGDDAFDAILEIWLPERELLFPTIYDKRFGEMWDKLIVDAGVSRSRKVTKHFHMLRRTVATQTAIQAGIPAAVALLDHSMPQLTIDHYIDPTQIPAVDASSFLPRLFSPTN